MKINLSISSVDTSSRPWKTKAAANLVEITWRSNGNSLILTLSDLLTLMPDSPLLLIFATSVLLIFDELPKWMLKTEKHHLIFECQNGRHNILWNILVLLLFFFAIDPYTDVGYLAALRHIIIFSLTLKTLVRMHEVCTNKRNRF